MSTAAFCFEAFVVEPKTMLGPYQQHEFSTHLPIVSVVVVVVEFDVVSLLKTSKTVEYDGNDAYVICGS